MGNKIVPFRLSNSCFYLLNIDAKIQHFFKIDHFLFIPSILAATVLMARAAYTTTKGNRHLQRSGFCRLMRFCVFLVATLQLLGRTQKEGSSP